MSRRIDRLACGAEATGPSAISLGALTELRRTVESLAKVAGITDKATDVKVGLQVTNTGTCSDQIALRLMERLNGNPRFRIICVSYSIELDRGQNRSHVGRIGEV